MNRNHDSVDEENLRRVSDFFISLREENFTVKKLADIIDIKKYDDETKEFELINYYVAFKRRQEILAALDIVNELMSEQYHEYINSQLHTTTINTLSNEQYDELLGRIVSVDDIKSLSDEQYYQHIGDLIRRNLGGASFNHIPPSLVDELISSIPSEDEYKLQTEQILYEDQSHLLPLIFQILAGNGVKPSDIDAKYVHEGLYKAPIITIDMQDIAFYNMAGLSMENEGHNRAIINALSNEASKEDFAKLREVPNGYGWPRSSIPGAVRKIWAEVDLNTPDDILISAFRSWLSETRKIQFSEEEETITSFSSEKVRESHAGRWHSLRVLAYLDLHIIDIASGSKLTHKNYADIIYPDHFDIDTTEKVRKTLQPRAEQALDVGYLDNLLKTVLSA
ncbi:DUF6387 family protein [Aeromonas sp.]|uniref:DUF6387 family protein n=1 Tax=Aeromonas sp. TaxID=647 RepID=UPI0025897F6B|nr:DUF6387 family protein [Aeromonas sp.]MCX7132720.1 DUF6387 family protein [Aeromonas sp.]